MIPAMSDGDAPFIRTSDGDRPGIAEGGGTDIVVANRLMAILSGKPLVQFRMGCGVNLELGYDHEVTIESSVDVVDGENRWSGEPMTAGAAGALLTLIQREVTVARVDQDGALVLGLGSATLTVRPEPMYEAWQVSGVGGLLIVCGPGGEHVSSWEPESR
jgi:hypothetical protein